MVVVFVLGYVCLYVYASGVFLTVFTQYSVWLCSLGMPLGGNKVIILDQ